MQTRTNPGANIAPAPIKARVLQPRGSSQEAVSLLLGPEARLPANFESLTAVEVHDFFFQHGIECALELAANLQRELAAHKLQNSELGAVSNADKEKPVLPIDSHHSADKHSGSVGVELPYAVHFTEWQCGHHCQRPEDIPVSSPEQASLILQAISHAISQPGHARAVLMNETHAATVYVTDDYVAVGHTDKAEFPTHYFQWALRPEVILGNASQIDEIHSPALAEAIESLHGGIERWDGKSEVWNNRIVTTTLSRAEVEAIAAPLDAYEDRRVAFELPPVFRAAAEVLEELRQEADDIAAMAQEGGAA